MIYIVFSYSLPMDRTLHELYLCQREKDHDGGTSAPLFTHIVHIYQTVVIVLINDYVVLNLSHTFLLCSIWTWRPFV